MGCQWIDKYWNVIFSDIPVASFALAEPVSARYFRIGRPKGPEWSKIGNDWSDRDDGGTFNFAEIEFSLADPTAVKFDSFAVGLDATTPIPYSDRTPIVSWDVGDSTAASFTVERGTSAEGPFFEVAPSLPSGTASWTDTTALVGVTYYYRVKAISVDADPRAFYSSIVSHTRDRRLERDPADLTKLRSGIALITDNPSTFWQDRLPMPLTARRPRCRAPIQITLRHPSGTTGRTRMLASTLERTAALRDAW